MIFGYPGGAVLPLYDALFQQDKMRHILVRHEQAAVHAAEGYARSTGKVGVVLVTSGPGATNTVTGLTDALMDSVPIVCLTGQVPTHMIGNDAFQEADTVGITRPCTKHNYLVKQADDLARVIHEAFHVARSGRPGPVVIDLPKNVQMAKAPYLPKDQVRHRTYQPARRARRRADRGGGRAPGPRRAPDLLRRRRRHQRRPEGLRALAELVRETGYPITLTLMGLGAYPASDPQFVGMLGMHGTYEANMAMHDCDVMVCIGARFDDRVTGRLDGFSPRSQARSTSTSTRPRSTRTWAWTWRRRRCRAVRWAPGGAWKRRSNSISRDKVLPWWNQIAEWQRKDLVPLPPERPASSRRPPSAGSTRPPRHRDIYVTTDVGQHQMWAAQHFQFEQPLRWMTSGGLGTMGYGFPAAIGVQVAHPDATVVLCISGDASWVMNMQEMSTAMQYRLPVKTFILNNSYMGMVRQWQDFFHGNRHAESYMDALPDFVKLAEAFGGVGLRAETVDELDGVIEAMLATDKPVIADIVVDRAENVYPMIPGGAAHNEIKLSPEDDGAHEAISEEGMVLV